MGGVMTAQRIHERHVADEPVFPHMATEVHELVSQIHRCRRCNNKPADIRRKNDFPKARESAKSRHDEMTILGVFGRFSENHSNTGNEAGTLTYYFEGIDAFEGASGGAALISLDGGKSYQILATMYGYNEVSKIGIYPRIRGEFSQHIEEYFEKWGNNPAIGGAS